MVARIKGNLYPFYVPLSLQKAKYGQPSVGCPVCTASAAPTQIKVLIAGGDKPQAGTASGLGVVRMLRRLSDRFRARWITRNDRRAMSDVCSRHRAVLKTLAMALRDCAASPLTKGLVITPHAYPGLGAALTLAELESQRLDRAAARRGCVKRAFSHFSPHVFGLSVSLVFSWCFGDWFPVAFYVVLVGAGELLAFVIKHRRRAGTRHP